jgi:uncharacterized protein (DUF1697 family)
MHTYISLLRGINVSGKNKLPMTALKDIYQALGCMHVTTYIQSGNVIFQAASNIEALAYNLSQAIKEKFGYTVPVLVREAAFFSSVAACSPFKDCDPSTLYVTLLGDTTHQEQIASITDDTWGEDRVMVQEGVIYVHCPEGYGRTLLNNNFFEKKGKTWATTRNWKTINRLVELSKWSSKSNT